MSDFGGGEGSERKKRPPGSSEMLDDLPEGNDEASSTAGSKSEAGNSTSQEDGPASAAASRPGTSTSQASKAGGGGEGGSIAGSRSERRRSTVDSATPSSRPETSSSRQPDLNMWVERREEMELAVMMGLHKRLGKDSPLKAVASEPPGIHLVMIYGADCVVDHETAAARAEEEERAAAAAGRLREEMEAAAAAAAAEEEEEAAAAQSASRPGSHRSSRPVTGASARQSTGASAAPSSSRPESSSGASNMSASRRRMMTAAGSRQEVAEDEEHVRIVDKRLLARRSEDMVRRTCKVWCMRGGADEGLYEWRRQIAKKVMQDRGWGGKVESTDAVTRRGMRELLKEIRAVEDKGRLFQTSPERALEHASVVGKWGQLDATSDVQNINDMVKREMDILRKCADGLAEGEARGIPALGDVWQRDLERKGVKPRDFGERVMPTLGPPARLSPALIKHQLYSVYGDAGGVGDDAARRALKEGNRRVDNGMLDAGVLEGDIEEARRKARASKEKLAQTEAQITFLRAQFSHNARVLGRLDDAEASLASMRERVRSDQTRLDRIEGRTAVRRIAAVEAHVKDQAGLVGLKQRVEEGYAQLAELAAEVAGCVSELHIRCEREPLSHRAQCMRIRPHPRACA